MADVLRAARALELPSHPALGQAILVPTDVISRPYPALSVLPDRCTVTFDRRTLPGESEEDVLEPLRTAVAAAVEPHGATGRVEIGLDRFDAYTGARVEAPNFAPAWYTGADAPVARTAIDALGAETGHWVFCTNGSGTAALGVPTIGYGPGDETLAHRVDEHISLDSSRRSTRIRGPGGGAHGMSERLVRPARRAGRPRPSAGRPARVPRMLPGTRRRRWSRRRRPPPRSGCGA